MNILLVAGKKELLSQESPTLNAWIEITMGIYKLDKITAFVNHKLEHFASHFEKSNKN